MVDVPRPNRPWILGIDLGANSVGWAALALGPDGEPCGPLNPPGEMGERPSLGVRIFEIGVENYGQGEREETRGKQRRQARLQRRQTMRRARRIRKTFYLLQQAGLLPPFAAEAIRHAGSAEAARDRLLKELDRDLAAALEPQFLPERRREAHELLPYLLRVRGLDHALDPQALGRALYHLSQRRGFSSNRKAGKKKDEDTGEVRKSISTLRAEMRARCSRSLAEHLLADAELGKRPRRRWTARDMYREEFEALWREQARHHPKVLTETLHKRLGRAILHQRPLKSQRNLVATCELENGGEYVEPKTGSVHLVKRRRRAPECLLVSQRFRLVQKVNDLAVVDDFGQSAYLTAEQRRRLIDDLETNDELTFAEIKKRLGLPVRKSKFNLEAGGERKLPGNRTNARLLKVFGPRWTRLSPEEKDLVVLELWSAPDDVVLVRRARERKGIWAQLAVTSSEADLLAEIPISSDYMSLSRRAMQRLLPVMEEGKPYITAKREVYGEPVPVEAEDLLPPVREIFEDLRNPVVQRALTELRRVVNALIKYYGKPEEIRIELARDLKRGKTERKRIQDRQRDNERERQKHAERITCEAGIASPNGTQILKARLWAECGGVCPYSGRAIGFAQLFDSDVDIEHILPLSSCLDDSFLNKTLCFADVNRTEKRNRTPHEAFGSDAARWEEMVGRMKVNVREHGMAPLKLGRFQLTGAALETYLETFKASQLNDTRHASVRAREYLARLYGGDPNQGTDADGRRRLVVGNGQATAILRDVLELDQVLPGGREHKREDHRHHAVDAVAIALTGPATIQALSCDVEYGRGRPRFKRMEPPWPGFADDVRRCVDRLVVSFRIDNRVRGPLHAETHYSAPRDERGSRAESGAYVHVRKPLESLSPSEVEDIVDERVRKLVIAKLDGRKPKDVFLEGNPESLPVLPNRRGAPIPILQVRIRKTASVQRIGDAHRERFVQNEENHHVELVETRDSRERVKWTARVVSLAEAHVRKRDQSEVVERAPGFVCALAKNDVVEMDAAGGDRGRYTIRGFSQFQNGTIQLTFSQNSDARPTTQVPKEGRTAVPDVLRKRGCRKVTVLPIGVVRPCRA